jgi:hypothetical protein
VADGRTVRLDPPISAYMAILRQSPERLDLQVRKVFRELAADVRTEARSRASGSHPVAQFPRNRPRRGTQHWKDLVNSIKSGASSTSPTVSIGSDRVPWALGFEFGSLRGPKKRQFPPWRGRGDSAGYFFYPAVRAAEDRIWPEMERAVDEAFAAAFPEG